MNGRRKVSVVALSEGETSLRRRWAVYRRGLNICWVSYIDEVLGLERITAVEQFGQIPEWTGAVLFVALVAPNQNQAVC